MQSSVAIRPNAVVARHAPSRAVVESSSFPLVSGQEGATALAGWTVRASITAAKTAPDETIAQSMCRSPPTTTTRYRLAFQAGDRGERSGSVGLTFDWTDWNTSNYVVLPGAVYAANRFRARSMPYPPLAEHPDDCGEDAQNVISDVARLALHNQPSRLHLPSHDLSTPAIGILDRRRRLGWWLLVSQGSDLGPWGLKIDESDDRAAATVGVWAPCVREGQRAFAPWTDRAHDFAPGQIVQIEATVVEFGCNDIPALFEAFLDVRDLVVPCTPTRSVIPFSVALNSTLGKFHRSNWKQCGGFFGDSVDRVHFQTGWVGGVFAPVAALQAPPEAVDPNLALTMASRNLDFIFSAQSDSGWLAGLYREGAWLSDGFDKPHAADWVLVRKMADTLLCVSKTLSLIGLRHGPNAILPSWALGLTRLAEACNRTWERYGQLGQFVRTGNGEIAVGGSASGGGMPAGLFAAADILADPKVSRHCLEMAEDFHRRWIERGITTGGPGEALQCPDSESAYAILESLVALAERTSNPVHIDMARDAAAHFASWVVSYDFEFPPGSALHLLGVHSCGTVLANSQNKHSAPGICTASGDALLRLYRLTNDHRYLRLLQDIARALPQFMSHPSRPVGGMAEGSICERVNLSDWEGDEKVGFVPPWSCWCENSMALTAVEIPSIYLDLTTRRLTVLDHIQATLSSDGRAIQLVNPLALPARVSVLAETTEQRSRALGPHALSSASWVNLPPISSPVHWTLPNP